MQVFLNIIYFLIALSVLVCIHELGHLSMAKLFDVYCDEFSIGFGPAIYQHKPKGMNKKHNRPKETKVSIRCLPLGGYVAMAGEGMEDVEELKNIPANRFLQGVAKWKRAIIMVAGVTLNFLLGLVLLFVGYSFTQTADYTKTNFVVTEEITYTDADGVSHTDKSPFLEAGLTSEIKFSKIVVSYSGSIKNSLEGGSIDKDGKALPSTYEYTINPGTYDKVGGTAEFLQATGNSYLPLSIDDTKSFVFTLEDGSTKEFTLTSYAASKTESNGSTITTYAWRKLGISTPTRSFTFGEKVTNTFTTFGEYSIAIFKAIGSLFVGTGFNNLGGPVAIVQQQMQMTSLGFGYFLLFWGLISINLGVVNLLPFPGLDGWHLLVCIVEGITKRDINPKVKSIMSFIGMILLFGLMIAITLKDILKLFFILI